MAALDVVGINLQLRVRLRGAGRIQQDAMVLLGRYRLPGSGRNVDEAVEDCTPAAAKDTLEELVRGGAAHHVTDGDIEVLPLAAGAEVQAGKVQLDPGAQQVDREIDVAAIAGRTDDGNLQQVVVLEGATLRNLVNACYVDPVHLILS